MRFGVGGGGRGQGFVREYLRVTANPFHKLCVIPWCDGVLATRKAQLVKFLMALNVRQTRAGPSHPAVSRCPWATL